MYELGVVPLINFVIKICQQECPINCLLTKLNFQIYLDLSLLGNVLFHNVLMPPVKPTSIKESKT